MTSWNEERLKEHAECGNTYGQRRVSVGVSAISCELPVSRERLNVVTDRRAFVKSHHFSKHLLAESQVRYSQYVSICEQGERTAVSFRIASRNRAVNLDVDMVAKAPLRLLTFTISAGKNFTKSTNSLALSIPGAEGMPSKCRNTVGLRGPSWKNRTRGLDLTART